MVRVRYSFSSRHTGRIGNIRKQKEKFPSVVKKVVDISDIILEVLDARFINKTRNFDIEDLIKAKGKKIIYVFNKADLIDVEELKKDMKLKPFVFVSCKTGYGAKDLRDRIKIEAKKVEGTLERIQIGIIGYPNTGKSSLINLITRRAAAKISKQAGFTKGMQKIRFTDNILILDTPGVIPERLYSSLDERVTTDAIFGARTFSDVKNPEDAVYKILNLEGKKLEDFYGIESEGDAEIFIDKVGRKKGFLKKGGEIDVDRTARQILRDWQEGKMV
jgi:ribosome biogenesis GTPase A